MGKSKKKNKINMNFGFSQGFEDQVNEGRVAKNKNKKFGKIQLRNEEDEDESFIDSKTTQRILKVAQKQRLELAKEFGPTPGEASKSGLYDTKKMVIKDNSDSESDSEQFDDNKEEYNEHDFFDDLKMNAEDEQALQMFQNK